MRPAAGSPPPPEGPCSHRNKVLFCHGYRPPSCIFFKSLIRPIWLWSTNRRSQLPDRNVASSQNPQTPPPNAVPLSQGGDGEQLLEVKISTMGAAPETASLPSPHSHHQLRVWIIYPASQGTERGQLTFPDLAAQDFTCIISFDLCKPYRRRSITQSPHITGKETEVLGDQTTSSKLQRKQMHLEPKAACHRSPDSSHSTLIPP